MKKPTKNLSLIFMITCIFISIFNVNTFAGTDKKNVCFSKVENEILPRGEVTGYKYKYFNGVKYKRLWSYTYNRWIDAEWTLA